MKLFHKIRNKVSKRNKVLLTLSTLTLLVATPLAVHAGFFPDRPTFDYNISGNGDCNDPTNPARNHGRCGSLNGPVFDSFINVPGVGDERGFLDAFRSDQTGPGTHADPVTNVTDGSQEVTMRLYIHNNANSGDNASGFGIAHNTAVRIALPTVEGNALRAVGYISATNATPATVEDTLDLTSTKNFTVKYEPGSARLFNNGPFASGVALSDNIVTSGAPVGYNALNGEFPGCFEFLATVEIKVKIIPKQAPVLTPNISIKKQVRITGTPTFASEVAAKPGDDVQFLLTTKNIGQVALSNTITRDVFPAHLRVDPGTVKVVNGQGTRVLADQPLFAGGFNLGPYNPGDYTYVTFKATVLDDFEGCSIRLRNYGHAKSDQTPNEVTDDADVVVTKTNCNTPPPPPPPAPTYACESLSVAAQDDRTVKITGFATSQTNGATFKNAVIDWGDNSTDLTTASPVNQTHQYAANGTYTVTATAHFMVNGQDVSATSANCKKPVTISVTPPPPAPTYTCDKLEITNGANRQTTYTVNTTTTGGAQVNFYRYDFGDGTPVLMTDKNTVQHTYAKDGQFASHVQVGFMVNGDLKTVDSPACTAAVTYSTPTTPPATTTTSTTPPTRLVNTGAGDVAGIFAAATVAGTLAYRWILGRRLSRQ